MADFCHSVARLHAEQVQLGRYGNLLGWYTPRQEDGLFVFEFGPQQCPLGEFAVVGETITATRFYYDFRDNSSGTVAVVGLVNDDRVASITLSRNGKPDAEAALGGGTFVIPANFVQVLVHCCSGQSGGDPGAPAVGGAEAAFRYPRAVPA